MLFVILECKQRKVTRSTPAFLKVKTSLSFLADQFLFSCDEPRKAVPRQIARLPAAKETRVDVKNRWLFRFKRRTKNSNEGIAWWTTCFPITPDCCWQELSQTPLHHRAVTNVAPCTIKIALRCIYLTKRAVKNLIGLHERDRIMSSHLPR